MGNCQVEITVISEAQVCGREGHQMRVHCWKQQEFTVQVEHRDLDPYSYSTSRIDEVLLRPKHQYETHPSISGRRPLGVLSLAPVA